MFEPLKHMLIKEFHQIFRDPRMRAILFITPIMQMLIFGYAVNTDVNRVAMAVFDLDNSVSSRELVSRFEQSPYFEITHRIRRHGEIEPLIDHDTVDAVVRIDKGFEQSLLGEGRAPVQLIVDGIDSNTARIVLNYTQDLTDRFSRDQLLRRLDRLYGARKEPAQLELESRAWFNTNLESRMFYVPGVIALLVMVVTILLTSMAVVREKEIGTMEQLIVTPVKSWEFILGKLIPFAMIGFLDVIMVSFIAVFWFDIPIRGNPLILLFSAGLYLMTTLGIGLFISTVSRTQQQAMMTTFFFIFPATLLSGFVFPIDNMPEVVQWITYLDPFRYFLVIIRGIFLKGVGIEILWPQMAALFFLGTVTLSLTLQRFQKTLV